MKAWFLHLFRHDWDIRNSRVKIAVCRYCKLEGWPQ